jgi:hypothetical protein
MAVVKPAMKRVAKAQASSRSAQPVMVRMWPVVVLVVSQRVRALVVMSGVPRSRPTPTCSTKVQVGGGGGLRTCVSAPWLPRPRERRTAVVMMVTKAMRARQGL